MLAEVGWKAGVGEDEECPARLVGPVSPDLLWGGPGTPMKVRRLTPQQDERALASRHHATIKTRAGID